MVTMTLKPRMREVSMGQAMALCLRLREKEPERARSDSREELKITCVDRGHPWVDTGWPVLTLKDSECKDTRTRLLTQL